MARGGLDREIVDAYPERHGRTQGFTLGLPRSFTVAGDGSRVAFLRTSRGDDRSNSLWVFDVNHGTERIVFDPRERSGGEEDLTPAERARRERAREAQGGVVAYDGDPNLRSATFTLGGRLYVADMLEGSAREVPLRAGAPFDPRISPDGSRVAYVADGALRVTDVQGEDRELLSHPDPEVTWGLAEFVAAEEMGRLRGFWWSPDGRRLVATRVDNLPVTAWHVWDPADPAAAPQRIRYPAAGTANADVSLWFVDLSGARYEIGWNREAFPYLARVVWRAGAPLALLVQSRDQRHTRVLTVNEATGATSTAVEDGDDAWVELVPGSPGWLDDGRLVRTVEGEDGRRLAVGDEPVTPPGMQVREVVDAGQGVVFVASEDPVEAHVWRWTPGDGLERLTETPGVHACAAGGNAMVVVSATMDEDLPTAELRRDGRPVGTIGTKAELPTLVPRVSFVSAGERELRTALVLPHGHDGARPLPVLLDPYGGPHMQRVVRSRGAFRIPQWFAEQGFAVVVVDGRGTPGRGSSWERAVHGDLAGPVLEDQVDALHAVAEEHPFLDLDRVAIRGWSFGGYLAALAVLRRPDVFHAAIAGAPVTDWRLYDTHYTERYLGDPRADAEAYERSSLLADADRLERPLLIVHGTSDDNVVVAHSLRLSRALFDHGRSHALLLPNVTHMTASGSTTENLLRVQLAFLHDALGLED